MQPGQHIHAHRHAGDEGTVQSFWRDLAILSGPGDGGEQSRRNEAEIELCDALGHADVCIVRGARMRRGLARFQSIVQRDGLVFRFTHASRLLV